MFLIHKLFVLEYSKSPCFINGYKYWSISGYNQYSIHRNQYSIHRNFDLPAIIDVKNNIKTWYRFGKYHRLIGPAYINYLWGTKYRFVNGKTLNNYLNNYFLDAMDKNLT